VINFTDEEWGNLKQAAIAAGVPTSPRSVPTKWAINNGIAKETSGLSHASTSPPPTQPVKDDGAAEPAGVAQGAAAPADLGGER